MSDDTIYCQSLPEAFALADIPYPPKDPMPGQGFLRFATSGQPGDTAGWCKVFDDGEGAVFGCYREGVSFAWQMRDKNASPPSPTEREAARVRLKTAKKQAERERAAQYADAAKDGSRIFSEAVELNPHHSYVIRKKITPYGARQGVDGSVVLPVYGPNGELQSIQRIREDGNKRFLANSRMKGGRMYLGTPVNGSPLVLTEGWATGCSVHEANGYTVAVAFSGNNLDDLAADLRCQFPDSPLLIAGDLDPHEKGLQYARSAAAAGAPAKAVMPSFEDGRNRGDFNDLHQAEGLEAVALQIDAAINLPPVAVTMAAPLLSSCDVRDGTNNTRPLTELGNAARLYDAYGDRLRYVYDQKSWMEWRDGAWRWDIDGAGVRNRAAQLPAAIYAEGTRHIAQGNHFSRWARTSQQQRVIAASVSLLADFPGLRMPMAHIDSEALLVGFDEARQIIDLTTGIVRAARQDDCVTKSLNITKVGDPAMAVRWMAFLDQVFAGDVELIDWVHRWCGYMLTGSMVEQCFVFAYGIGANGKSIFAETLKHVMGDYARAVAPETLSETRRKAGSATPDLAALIGARLVLSTETEEGAALAETLVKSLVSGDSMSVRQLYAGPVQFTPKFKLLMLGNHKPVIRGSDNGIWRRVRLLPFRKTFAPDERDPYLLEKLKTEAPHISAWMVRGCIQWNLRGLADMPTAVRAATDEYRRDQDIVGEWLAECCIMSPSYETEGPLLYRRYRTWCEDNGHRPSSNTVLGRRLSERSLTVRRSNGKRFWSGICLRSDHRSESSVDKGIDF